MLDRSRAVHNHVVFRMTKRNSKIQNTFTKAQIPNTVLMRGEVFLCTIEATGMRPARTKPNQNKCDFRYNAPI